MTLHVAVVDRVAVSYRSARPAGDYAAFIGANREDVIERALKARNKWGRDIYRVLVGTLTAEAREPVRYEVVSLADADADEQRRY